MNFNFKDSVWIIGVILALGMTWGMTSQRISAMEKDVDRLEEALILFTKMESRIAVIETEVKISIKNLIKLKDNEFCNQKFSITYNADNDSDMV